MSRVKYLIPTRGLLGLKTAMLSATRGTAVLNTQFIKYDTMMSEFSTRENGSLIAFETGQVTAYALTSAQERGIMFAKPGDEVRRSSPHASVLRFAWAEAALELACALSFWLGAALLPQPSRQQCARWCAHTPALPAHSVASVAARCAQLCPRSASAHAL